MLGFSPISAAPFSSLSGGANFDGEVVEASTVVGIASAIPTYLSTLSESVVSSETMEVSASVFTALSQESDTVSDTANTVVSFAVLTEESAQALDNVLALATFQAYIEEAATTIDAVSAAADFVASITETATGADATSSLATFVTNIVESGVISDILALTTVQNGVVAESASGLDAVSTLVVFRSIVAELLTATDSDAVAPSIFNAAVSEEVNAVEQFLAAVTFIATIQAGAQAADQLLARFLWELINDQQLVNWAGVSAAQSTEWVHTYDSQPATWDQIPTKL